MRGLMTFIISLSVVLATMDIEQYQETGYYRITSIKEKREIYIIRATKKKTHHRTHYLIVSKKEPDSKGKRIMVGKTYYLELSRLLPIKAINGIDVAPNLGVVGLHYGSTEITTNKRFHYSIYSADNIHGLYLDIQ